MLGAIDDVGDALFAVTRSRRSADRAAAAISAVADYGFVWVLLAGAKAWRPGPSRRRAVVALGAAGISSYTLNRAAKQLAGRQRPAGASADATRTRLARRPTSSSFPSGHVLAAYCAAIVVPEGRAGRAAGLSFATAVAASRVHLEDHHASDVVSGAILGALTGLAVRRVVDRLAGTSRRHGHLRFAGDVPGDACARE